MMHMMHTQMIWFFFDTNQDHQTNVDKCTNKQALSKDDNQETYSWRKTLLDSLTHQQSQKFSPILLFCSCHLIFVVLVPEKWNIKFLKGRVLFQTHQSSSSFFAFAFSCSIFSFSSASFLAKFSWKSFLHLLNHRYHHTYISDEEKDACLVLCTWHETSKDKGV